ncbi:glycoside hydrolase family 2 TIM barrel-domain containing protein [Paraflavitalea sp. CAU 1676]|uniref:glycoside hydrolase family 2 protein n=1 Tax=Paraflavitalea sp. CAU 1676 TaxID=3032598 RepID=UPI0023DA3146|nr:glycoside hydrolase family 2 TIM barrel-domain containing protein [Paraflavitalea sp. CAU 1676]MDF2188625.1 glycoside hydrolase family 2 TIM barrel-domain containing protein [Paraflavitalea sp. CAU 1676]
MKRRYWLVLGGCFMFIQSLSQTVRTRQETPFTDQWQFSKPGMEWTSVSVPHTWNNVDMQTTKDFYQGVAQYKKEWTPDTALRSKRVFLRFEGVGAVADLFVNDKFIGQHKGGYGAFAFDIAPVLKWGEVNTLVVKASNESREDVIPINHRLFGVYGGIYRPVKLIVTDKVHIAVTDNASSGVFIRQRNVSPTQATIDVTTKLENKRGRTENAVIETTVYDAKGKLVKTVSNTVAVKPQGLQHFPQSLSLLKPHLWQGLDDPYLYRLTVRVKQNGVVIDEVSQPLGVRKFEVVARKGFYLNGKPYPLLGVCRHQDWWGSGSALTNEQHAADLATIREMGATSIRLAHYQQSEYFYSKADSMGMIIWAEIPFVNQVSGKEGDNAKQQLVELIRQNFNHPSIYVWGLHNEVYGKSAADYTTVLTSSLHEIAKTEDPDRYTISVNGYGSMERYENQVADLQGMNRYYGWYEGKTPDLEKWVNGLADKYPDHKVILSEYGAEGNVYQQDEQPPMKFDPVNGQYFPEQMETRFHEIQWGIIAKQHYLAGSYLWNMFDFAVPLWNRGGIASRNLKGLVTFDRTMKKDAFYWYKANWSKEPVLYIADRRLVHRKQATTAITVYSNKGTPSLTVNGKVIPSFKQGTTGVHYIFDSVALEKGVNKISVRTGAAGNTLSDEVEWTLE